MNQLNNFPSPEGSEIFQSVTMSSDRSEDDACHTEHESNIDTGIEDIILKKILLIIESTKGHQIAVSTVITCVWNTSEQIQNYLGDKLTTRENRRIRDLFLRIIRHPNIEVVKHKPQLIVRWSDKESTLRDAGSGVQSDMIDEHQSEVIKISSIIITDRTRKDLGNIASLAESISLVGLMQSVVINENNELIDGQRRIKAYIQLGIKEIPFFRVNLKEIILGEFHANFNRKDLTTSERVAISSKVAEFLRKHSRSVGKPKSNQKINEIFTNETEPSLDLASSEYLRLMWSI